MTLIAISGKRSCKWQAYRFLCVFSFQAWKYWCTIAWMRYWFSQLHRQGDGNHYLPRPPGLEGRHNLVMQFHLNVMACVLCTSEQPNLCSGAKTHNSFFLDKH